MFAESLAGERIQPSLLSQKNLLFIFFIEKHAAYLFTCKLFTLSAIAEHGYGCLKVSFLKRLSALCWYNDTHLKGGNFSDRKRIFFFVYRKQSQTLKLVPTQSNCKVPIKTLTVWINCLQLVLMRFYCVTR